MQGCGDAGVSGQWVKCGAESVGRWVSTISMVRVSRASVSVSVSNSNYHLG